MSEAKWSPEPWIRGEEHELKIKIQQARPPYHHVATAHASYFSDRIQPPDGRTMDANARRIIACVNACQGIPTEALESGALGRALAALGGRSGRGHNVQSSGRNECGECHHPNGKPWHMDDCSVGAALRALGRLK